MMNQISGKVCRRLRGQLACEPAKFWPSSKPRRAAELKEYYVVVMVDWTVWTPCSFSTLRIEDNILRIKYLQLRTACISKVKKRNMR